MNEIIVLMDNNAIEDLKAEWGFSLLIKFNDKHILLDAGASPLFLENLSSMNENASDVDYAILSHSHFDHANGFLDFLDLNKSAPLYLSSLCKCNCYKITKDNKEYIGLPKELFENYSDRLVKVDSFIKIDEGVYLVPHINNHMNKIGKKVHMFREENGKYHYDDFLHEYSLVIENDDELIVMNSCTHSGLENVVKDVEFYLPNKKIKMFIGGLHLAFSKDREIRKVSKIIKELGIEKVYSGHCTGDNACSILKEELNDSFETIYSGKVINF